MKKLLPILLCYVLMTSQVYAISGGPVLGGSSLNPVGTYSGVINVNQELDNDNPVVDPVTGDLVPASISDFNAIGLFSLAVPDTSVATGSFILFVDGEVFSGTITASVDPDSGKLSGIVEGTFPYTVNIPTSTGTVTTESLTATASGQITAQVGATRQGSISSASLSGSSTLDVAFGGLDGLEINVDRILVCTVSGFRQSVTATATTVTSGTSTTGGG